MSINSASASELNLVLKHITDECVKVSAIPSSHLGGIKADNKLEDISQSLRDSQSFYKTFEPYSERFIKNRES